MQVNIDMPGEMKQRLDELRDQTGLSISDLVRLAIKKQLDSQEPITIDFSQVAP